MAFSPFQTTITCSVVNQLLVLWLLDF
ncbi:unnamed protein product, partial [Rotaria sp. Silwood2]